MTTLFLSLSWRSTSRTSSSSTGVTRGTGTSARCSCSASRPRSPRRTSTRQHASPGPGRDSHERRAARRTEERARVLSFIERHENGPVMTAVAEPGREDERRAHRPPAPAGHQGEAQRGRQAAKKDAPTRRLCHKFWEGDHYWYQNAEGALRFLSDGADRRDRREAVAPDQEHVQLHPEHRRREGQRRSRSGSPATRSTRAARTTRTGRPRGSRSRSRSTGTTSGTSAGWARRSRRSRSCSARGSRCRTSTRAVGPFKNGRGRARSASSRSAAPR
jgi:hypothetical protein